MENITMHVSEYMSPYAHIRDNCNEEEALRLVHREYYGQYVDQNVRLIVLHNIGMKDLLASKDFNFNNISLFKWGGMVLYLGQSIKNKLKENGDILSQVVGVCILKEAARQLVEEYKM